MKLRIYRPGGREEIYQLFYDTVHFVNRADYSPEQLDAWAPRQISRSRWEQSLAEHETWVAWEEGRIVGFGDLAQNGYLDRLYVRKDSVRKGVASALLHRLEAAAVRQGCRRMDTEVSITAGLFLSIGATGWSNGRKAAARAGICQFCHGKNLIDTIEKGGHSHEKPYRYH